MSIKIILLPTDFSEAAKNALEYAAGIALKHTAKIILLHSIEADYKSALYNMAVAASEPFKKEAHTRLLAQKHLLLEKGVDNDHVISEQSLVDMVLSEAEIRNADMIVMGTSGARGIKKIMSGSNAGRIVEQANCPVLVISEKIKYNPLVKVVYATDYHEADETAIAKTVALIRPYQGSIKILHFVTDVSRSESDKMVSFIHRITGKINYPHISYEVVNLKKSASAIEDYLSPESCNLLVVSSRQRYLIQRVFDESLAKELAFDAKLPLLVFHHALKPLIL